MDQTEFYRRYFGYVVRFVTKYGGIAPQDAEDVANQIWVRFLVTDVLGQFDPEHVIVHNGKQYKPRFESFLAKKLDLYVRHYRKQQALRRQREVYINSEADSDELFDLLAGGVDVDMFADLEEAELVAKISEYLRRVPPRVEGDALDLERVFLIFVSQNRAYGRVTVKELAALLQVTTGTAQQWLKIMRRHIGDCLTGKTLPPRPEREVISRDQVITFGGVACTVVQLQEALQRLQADGTNMIKQPLAKVASPLAACDYHGVCANYRSAFPDFTATRTRHLEKETFMAALADVISRFCA